MKNGLYPGSDLILSHETAARPVQPKLLEKMIDVYLLS